MPNIAETLQVPGCEGHFIITFQWSALFSYMEILNLLKCVVSHIALWKKRSLYRYKEENPNKTEWNTLYIQNIMSWHVEDLCSPIPSCSMSNLIFYLLVLSWFRVKTSFLGLNKTIQHCCNLWFRNHCYVSLTNGLSGLSYLLQLLERESDF